MEVYRHTFWAIPPSVQILLYVLGGVSMLLFVYGFYRRYRLWKLGRPSPISLRSNWKQRVIGIISQKRVREDRKKGRMHMLLSAGMVVLFLGTVLVFFDHDLQLHFLRGWVYLVYELVLEWFGILFLIGVGWALYTRMVNQQADQAILWLLLAIGISGFVIEGLRLAITTPSYGGWSFVGYGLGILLQGVSSPTVYLIAWVFHMVVALAFIALIPYSKLMHMFLAPVNILIAPPLEETEVTLPYNLSKQSVEDIAASQAPSGLRRPKDFTFTQLLSVDACTECGRCNNVCPASLSGKPLFPREVILKLRDQMHQPDQTLSGFTEEELLSCTTCGACMERCPVSIRHVPIIISLRQGMVAENQIETEMVQTLSNLQTYHNPWGQPSQTRADWLKGVNVAQPVPPEKREEVS